MITETEKKCLRKEYSGSYKTIQDRIRVLEIV